MSGANWDLKPSTVIMNAGDYRDMVVYGLEADGWSHRAARVEADRRLQVMHEEAEEANTREAVEALWVDLSPRAKTFGGTLLRDTFEGAFPPGMGDAHREDFFAKEDLPKPAVRAYLLGLSHRDGGLSDAEQEEWETLQGAHP